MNFDQEYDTQGEFGEGGMAVVYKARRRRDGKKVAVKRPRSFPNCAERLKREVDVLTKIDHPHVMPVLESGTDEDGNWFYAMPVALGSLKDLWQAGSLHTDVDTTAAEVLKQVCLGVEAMHIEGYLHRDIKPANILALRDESLSTGYRWVIADCGLVRRPLGETTVNLTGSATFMGTDGYVAPETYGDPHNVTEAADVYSLGRVLAWLTTGETPVLTRQLLPEGSWRPVVRELTYEAPGRRPQSMSRALTRAHELRAELPTSERAHFRTQIRENGGNLKTDNQLWDVVLDSLEDHVFMFDDLVLIAPKAAKSFTISRPDDGARIGERLARHLVEGNYAGSYDHVNTLLDWIHSVLDGLLSVRRFGLLEDVAVAYCTAVAAWDRFRHNDMLEAWLAELRDPGGEAIARAIHQSGEVEYFRQFAERKRLVSPRLLGLLES